MNAALGNALLALARRAITERLGRDPGPEPASGADVVEELARPGATFVTLKIAGDLRGCIGTLRAHRPLREDCTRNAIAAAFEDPRFPPLSGQELSSVRIEISVLSPSRPFPCKDEADACARLVRGVHGVILYCHGHRATFLPQVWEQLPDPKSFLAALRRKAGLPLDAWDSDMELQVYEVEHVEEERS